MINVTTRTWSLIFTKMQTAIIVIILFYICAQGTIILSEEEFHHTIRPPQFIKHPAMKDIQTPRQNDQRIFKNAMNWNENLVENTSSTGELNPNPSSYEYGDFLLNFLNDMPQQYRGAILKAIDILSDILIDVPVKISVDIDWTKLATGVLASAGPKYIYLSQDDGFFYTSSVANQHAGTDLDPNSPDILMSINSGASNWYYGTNDTEIMPSGTYDMVTAVLHELLHGLGWIGLIKSDGSYGGDGEHLYKYDNGIIIDQTSQRLIFDLPTNKTLTKKSFGDKLDITSPSFKWVIYNPSPFKSGSSIYHLDESTYPDGNENSLMTPILKSRQRIHSPGPASLSVLQYLGWTVRDCSHYQSSCNTCTLALCYWCGNGMCLSALPSSNSSTSTESCSSKCPSCYSNSDCQDPTNLCTIGICIQSQGICSYSTIDCGAGKYCDSLKGCVSSMASSVTPSPTPSRSISKPPPSTNNVPKSGGLLPSICNPQYAVVAFIANPLGSKSLNSVDGNQVIVPFIPITQTTGIQTQQYDGWYISDITMNVILDKVDNLCMVPTHSSVRANELYIQLVIKPSIGTGSTNVNETLVALAKQSFTKFSTFNGPYNWTFTSMDASSGNSFPKLSTQSPKNGTFKSFQRVDQIFSSSPQISTIPDTRFGALKWWLVFGDTTLGNPSCFYGSKLWINLVKPVDPISLPKGVLCKSSWTLQITPEMLSISFTIPANFFSPGSKSLTINSVNLCDCKNKLSGLLSLGFDTTDDLLISNSANFVYSTNVKVTSINFCSTGNITTTNGKGQKQTRNFTVRLDGFSPDPQSSGTLLIDPKRSMFTFSASAKVSLNFPPSNYLWYDNPPGYISPQLIIEKTSKWDMDSLLLSKML